MEYPKIKTLFLDIGSVLISNGWDRFARQRAVDQFRLEPNEFSDRHHIFFETYEAGKMTLAEYLDKVIFYEHRDFTAEAFMDFMFRQSVAIEGSIEYFMALKNKYGLNIVAVNNEGRELNEHRIITFRLTELFNLFISSCYVHLRKPDKQIFRLACDVSFTDPEHALYIDDRIIHIQIAGSLGIQGIHFTGLESTKKQMEGFGFFL